MATLKTYKVISTLPDPLEPSAIYYVRTGVGIDVYVTDSTGSAAYKSNSIEAETVTATKSALIPSDKLIGLDSENSGSAFTLDLAQLSTLLGVISASGTSLGLWDYWHQTRFGNTNANVSEMFAGVAVSSGTNTSAVPSTGQAGYNTYGVFLRSGTTANGGYRYTTTSMVSDYFGTTSHKFRAQYMPKTGFTGRTVRVGYLDTITSADATDGAYFEIVDAICTAKTSSASTRTSNATTVSLSLDEAYTFDIEVNADATEVRFRVYVGDTYTAILDVTNTTNIPNSQARGFGAGIIATESSTTASDIGLLYSLSLGTVEGFTRAVGVYTPPATVPAAFTSGDWTSTAGDGEIIINVITLPDNGGSSITALEYTLNGGSTWISLTGTSTGSRTITGLTNSTSYPVQLRAVNAVGGGTASDIKNTTPALVGGGAGLTIVQDPDKVESIGDNATRTLSTPVVSGNGLIVSVRCNTSAGAPVLTDNQGGAWGAPVATVAEALNGTTSYYYLRNNVTSGLSSVTVTASGSYETCIGVVEAAGGTLTLDVVINTTYGTTVDPWDVNFTSAEDDSIVVGTASFSNSTTITSVPPLTSNATAEYFGYFRGVYPTAGLNNAQLDLNDGRQGSVSGIVVKGM